MSTEETPKFIYRSTKTFTHSQGLSCCFRQWRAESHCQYLHGYAIQVKLMFATHDLDIRNWAVDFGSLKSLKSWLEDTFDHKTVVAEDDPLMHTFEEMEKMGMIQLRVLPSAGCEKFAEAIWHYADMWLQSNGYKPRCWLEFVEVREHEGNSAIVAVQPQVAIQLQEQELQELNRHPFNTDRVL